MTVNFRRLLLVLLFCCLANALFSQDNDSRKYRIPWTEVEHALRYEVLIEKEENGKYENIWKESTEEPFIDVSLSLGNYRFRVIPYDFRDVPGEGSEWRYFRPLAVPASGSEPQLVIYDAPPSPLEPPPPPPPPPLPEPDTGLTEAVSERDSTPPEPDPGKHSDLYLALFAEGIGYSRYSAAFGGGIAFGGSFKYLGLGMGLGITLLYAQDPENLISLEALAHYRLYLPYSINNTSLFVQAEAGIVLIAFEKIDNTSQLTPSAGLAAGWRFPLGTRFYIEPVIRGGYPYIFGAGLSAGIKFY